MKKLELRIAFITFLVIAMIAILYALILPLKKNLTIMDGFFLGIIAGAFFSLTIVTGVLLYFKKESD